MKQNKNSWFYVGESGLDRTDDFQKFCGSGLDWIQFHRIRAGLGLKNFTGRSFPLASRDEHGSGLKQFWLDQYCVELQFFENWRIRTGSDWENFCYFNVIILKTPKILVLIRFHRFVKPVNGSVYFAIKCKNSPGTILQFELHPFLFTFNVEF